MSNYNAYPRIPDEIDRTCYKQHLISLDEDRGRRIGLIIDPWCQAPLMQVMGCDPTEPLWFPA